MSAYFPFDKDIFEMKLGARPVDLSQLIEVEPEDYQLEIALKNSILAQDYSYYFQAAQGTEALQWETIEVILPQMARRYPEHFCLKSEGESWLWQNKLLESETRFQLGVTASLPLPPLDWLGRQVQEDLLLMDGQTEAGIPLVAGQLCFANDWCLGDKMGKSFLNIHTEVPLFHEQIGYSSSLLMERLKPGRPVWRLNWSIKTSNRLNLATRFSREIALTKDGLTPENVGERCYLRLERQTLCRLPRTNGILFTVRTYQTRLTSLTQNPLQARNLLGILKTAPPPFLEYKGITSFAQSLITYLENLPPDR